MAKRVIRTDQEKKKILAYVDEHGPIAAEKKFGIGRSQIYAWRARFESLDSRTEKARKKKKAKSQRKKRLTVPDGSMRTAAVEQANSDRSARTRRSGIKALLHAAALDRLAEEAVNEDRTEDALALYAGAAALRKKVTS